MANVLKGLGLALTVWGLGGWFAVEMEMPPMWTLCSLLIGGAAAWVVFFSYVGPAKRGNL